MNENIEKADRIVGIKEDMWWASTSGYPSQNTYRRGAYCEWLGTPERKKAAKLSLCDFSPLEDIAAEVVRIDAEERRTKEPADGLPPGPWKLDKFFKEGSVVVDVKGDRVCVFPTGKWANAEAFHAIADHIVRCGSPAIRRLLAAYDVTDERVHDGSAAVIRMANEAGTVCATRAPWAGAEILCWLTPRSKP